ncbi:MAG: DUF423 domain-containing protein [Alphaproteobacteria bacterium]|jgi:uncharacterized membrane protein YgdD (TMEM256/DUF423 family)|nr:DUF423 domain-containing protein [Alphaproteobacteria bacterium]MDP7223471.1 DUF423 domain-containing protein [Alphaproteobacteria bacterium]
MNKLLISGATLGLIAVIMGALGDHTFTLTPDTTESLQTAIRYNMLYAVLISCIALAPSLPGLRIAGLVFTAGTILFSFSIYAAIMTGIDSLTYITPLGGLMIMAGWGCLIYAGFKRHAS